MTPEDAGRVSFDIPIGSTALMHLREIADREDVEPQTILRGILDDTTTEFEALPPPREEARVYRPFPVRREIAEEVRRSAHLTHREPEQILQSLVERALEARVEDHLAASMASAGRS